MENGGTIDDEPTIYLENPDDSHLLSEPFMTSLLNRNCNLGTYSPSIYCHSPGHYYDALTMEEETEVWKPVTEVVKENVEVEWK